MVISLLVLRNERVLLIATAIGCALNILLHSGVQIDYSVLRYTCIYFVFFGVGLLWKTKLLDVDGILPHYRFSVVITEGVIFVVLYCLQETVGFESLNIISGFIGINIVMLLSTHLENSHKGKALEYLGIRSMSIYLLHGPILVVARTVLVKIGVPVLVASLIMFIVGLLVSLLIDKYILHLNCVTEYVFLGINSKK